MLKTLNLVRGAVAEKELIPVLTHFHIYDGRIQGGNGRITIDAPLPELKGMDVTVPADKFLRAIDACTGEPKIKKTQVNLIITDGDFRVQLPVADHAAFPRTIAPEPKQWHSFKTNLLPTCARLRKFIGTDASRPWLCSIHFKDNYAYATTNPVMARVPWDGQDMTLPVYCIDELLRIGIEPKRIAVSDNAITFDLGNDIWLQTRLIDAEWPDVSQFFKDKAKQPVPVDLATAINRIVPFCPDAQVPGIHLSEEGVSTADGSMSAQIKGVNLPEGYWHANNLLLVLSEAQFMDLGAWPNPCPWAGDNIEGIAVGLRA